MDLLHQAEQERQRRQAEHAQSVAVPARVDAWRWLPELPAYQTWRELKRQAAAYLRQHGAVIRGKAYRHRNRDQIMAGWGSLKDEIRTIEQQHAGELAAWQRRARADIQPAQDAPSAATTPLETSKPPAAGEASPDESNAETAPTLRTYPSVNAAFLRQDSPVLRLWYLLRHVDTQGRGIVTKADARGAFCDRQSTLYCMTAARLRQVLQAGEDTCWNVQGDLIHMRSVARVAEAVGVDKLRGSNVAVPVADMLGGMRQVRAALWATIHAARRPSPIARETLADVFGLPSSTQRAYDAEAGTVREQNIAVIPDSAAADHKYTRRRIVGGEDVLTAHMPSTYKAALKQDKPGRKSKVNDKLNALVSVSPQKRGSGARRYFANEAAAARAARQGRWAYHATGRTLTVNVCKKTRLEAANVWSMAV